MRYAPCTSTQHFGPARPGARRYKPSWLSSNRGQSSYYITSQSPIPRATDGRLHSSEGIPSAVMVTAAPDRFDFPREEEKTLELWKRLDAFQTCLKQSKDRPRYTFYDGPPFATGLPHYGHILAGTIKVWTLKCLLYWGKPERARHIAVRRGLRPLSFIFTTLHFNYCQLDARSALSFKERSTL